MSFRSVVGKAFGAAILAGVLTAEPAVAGGPISMPAPAPVAAATNWDGFWVGGGVGWKWIDTDYRGTPEDWAVPPATTTGIFAATLLSPGSPVPKSGSVSPNGFTGGGLIGVNRQRGQWVFGVEGTADFVNAKETQTTSLSSVADYDGVNTSEIDFANRTETCRNTKDMRFEGSLQGRVGYLVTQSTLFFVTAGVSGASVEHEVDCLSRTEFFGANASGLEATHTTRASGSSTDWEFGYIFGVGAERQLRDNRWRGRFDYAYVNLNATNQTVAITRTSDNTDVVNSGPEIARYRWDEDYHKIRFSLIRTFGAPAPAPFK